MRVAAPNADTRQTNFNLQKRFNFVQNINIFPKMWPSIFTDVYNAPNRHRPPTGAALFNNTDYPNLNSVEYRTIPIERTIKMHPIWECIALNEKGHVAIGTNKGHGREWCSTIWSFENAKKIEPKNETFRLQAISHVTNLAYMRDNFLLATFRNGGIQLWSTYSKVRNKDQPYSLFLVGKKFEHERPIECLELMGPNTTKAITGGQDFTLKIWDFGEADLQSINTYRYAHLDTIKGIADLKAENSIFATSSRDKSVLLWDRRDILPATALYENHLVGFQDITWAESLSTGNYHLYVGDESGYVHLIDKRKKNEFVKSVKHFDRPIRKLLFQNDFMAIIANSNIVKIFSISKNDIIYESHAHEHFVRDCIWYNSSTLLTVGSDGKLVFHKIPI